MLSLFPELLFLAPLAAFVIRIATGLTLVYMASKHITVSTTAVRTLGVVEGIAALLLIAGAYTQAAALAGIVIVLFSLFAPSYRTLPRSTLILLAILALSLIVTGAGPFAVDLPL